MRFLALLFSLWFALLSFATVYDVDDVTELEAALAAAVDGDTIRFTTGGTYTATADYTITKSITIDANGKNPTLKMTAAYDINFNGQSGGTTIVWYGPMTITGAKHGPIGTTGWRDATSTTITPFAVGDWINPSGANTFVFECTAITTGITSVSQPTWNQTPGVTTSDTGVTWTCRTPSDAVMRIRPVAGNITFTGYQLTFNGDHDNDNDNDVAPGTDLPDRLFQVAATTDSWTATADLWGCALTESYDDQTNCRGSDSSDTRTGIALLRLRGCTMSGSVAGNGTGAHYGGKTIVYGGTISGEGLVTAGPGLRGNVELYSATLTHASNNPAFSLAGGGSLLLDGCTVTQPNTYVVFQCSPDGASSTTGASLTVRNSTITRTGNSADNGTDRYSTFLLTVGSSGQTSTIEFSDSTFAMTGDPREDAAGGSAANPAGFNIAGSGTVNFTMTRCKVDFSGVVASASPTAAVKIVFVQNLVAASTVLIRGSEFLGIALSNLANLFVQTAVDATPCTIQIYDNTFHNDIATNTSHWGIYTRNAGLSAVNNVFSGCLNGVHADGTAGNYRGSWNVFRGCTNNVAGSAALQTGDVDMDTLAFVSTTWPSVNLRISAGGTGEARTTSSDHDVYQREPWTLTMRTSNPGGTISRSPAFGGPFPLPANPGAYAVVGTPIVVDSTDTFFMGYLATGVYTLSNHPWPGADTITMGAGASVTYNAIFSNGPSVVTIPLTANTEQAITFPTYVSRAWIQAPTANVYFNFRSGSVTDYTINSGTTLTVETTALQAKTAYVWSASNCNLNLLMFH